MPIRKPTPAQVALLILLGLLALRFRGPQQTRDGSRDQLRHTTVRKVLDGDTFIGSRDERVRLLGIDAPEVEHGDASAEPYARESLDWLKRRIEGRRVTLRVGERSTDKYGRTLAWVSDEDGQLINRESLHAGWSRLLADFGLPLDLEPELRRAEAEALIAHRGIWKR